METIEQLKDWRERYASWRSKQQSGSPDNLDGYPFVENARAPFTPLRRSLSMLNLALISSAAVGWAMLREKNDAPDDAMPAAEQQPAE